jgi:hypothetical protein
VTAGIHLEVWLVCAYAVFLLVTGAVLERLAWHCHRRSHHIRTAGFHYRREFDAWECPAGQFLTRAAIDQRMQLAVYRAPAHACNRCALKALCTDSDEGREIALQQDAWPRSEIGRFHRGISLTLCGLAALITVVEIARHHASSERLLLSTTLLLSIVAARRLVSALANERVANEKSTLTSKEWHRATRVARR